MNLTECLRDYLSSPEIDIRDIKLLRYYSALSGDKEVVSLIDYYLEKYYGEGEDGRLATNKKSLA